jgi:hypothetical protein
MSFKQNHYLTVDINKIYQGGTKTSPVVYHTYDLVTLF